MRWAFVGTILGVLVACGGPAEDDEAAAGEGWSGTPPIEPRAPGEACDLEWAPCVDGAYCEVSESLEYEVCGDHGVCVEIPGACAGDGEPRCGCDGVLYADACAAAMAGVSVADAGRCPAPAGRFECGLDFCEAESEYCEHVVGHGLPESWTCRPLGCVDGVSGCACITAPSPCGEPEWFALQECSATEEGGTLLLCLPY